MMPYDFKITKVSIDDECTMCKDGHWAPWAHAPAKFECVSAVDAPVLVTERLCGYHFLQYFERDVIVDDNVPIYLVSEVT
jgi:hypothetical protein